jgi:transcriptional regulator with XRE-family HTH domain
MCRELRVNARLKQREVAARIGIAVSSYGNVESNPHKTIRRERAERIGKLYELSAAMQAQLMAAWEAQPVTEYSQKQRESWSSKHSTRSKVKNHDRMKLGLLEMTTLLITNVADPGALCTCSEVDMFAEDSSGQQCELCDALRLLGLTGWTTMEEVVAKLAAVQEGMTG